MNPYEYKRRWKYLLLFFAIVIAASSLWYTDFLVKGISKSERTRAEVWSQSFKKLFDTAAGIIAVHQKKEELILFPFIRKMADAKKNNKEFVSPRATKSVESPVDMLTHEHHQQGDLFQQIAGLSQDYASPEDVDDTIKDSLRLLKEFELNLHKHLHLENNILFPKALEMEKELTV